MRKHLLFWFLYVSFTVAIYYVQEPDLLLHLSYELASLPAKLMMVYFTLYFVLPRFLLQKRYAAGVGLLLLSLFISILLLYSLVSLTVYPVFFPEVQVALIPANAGKLISPLLDLVIVTSLAIVIKLFQEREKNERERLQLARINAQHALQLLRSQLHPHFLFNTLNGLYAYTLEAPDKAADMIVKLSALLRFMLYEGSQPQVQLERELIVMQHYIDLEKLRYENKLQVELKITGTPEGQRVVPLMMLPFFENAFKHGPSRMHGSCFIRGKIRLEPGWLHLDLENTKKEPEEPDSHSEGIGLKNVHQRLLYHYGKRFELRLNDQPDRFTVFLKIPLS